MNKVLGFDIRFKFDGKYIAGVTQDSFTLRGKLRESIMKSNQGNKEWENIGREVNGSATLFIMKGESAEYMDIGDVREAVAASTTGSFEYGGDVAGDHLVTGNCMFTEITETTDSENFGTATVNWQELEGQGGFGVQS